MLCFCLQSSDEMYSKNLRKWLVPFLRQTERQTSGSYISLLRQYILNMAQSDLAKPLLIFEASKTHVRKSLLLFGISNFKYCKHFAL